MTDNEEHKLHYTDPLSFTGPMTQVMKSLFPSCDDPDHSISDMQVDGSTKFDCGSLPNLNESFSDIGYDGFDQTPREVRLYLHNFFNFRNNFRNGSYIRFFYFLRNQWMWMFKKMKLI